MLTPLIKVILVVYGHSFMRRKLQYLPQKERLIAMIKYTILSRAYSYSHVKQ